MKLIEALTTKRPEDGKVADWAARGLEKYKVKPSGDLDRYTPHTGWMLCVAEIDLFTRTDFTPVWETPAPMVPIAGEVWAEYGIPCWMYRRGGSLFRIWGDSISGRISTTDGMIHGQNGWRLVYSPDPERMRRSQG